MSDIVGSYGILNVTALVKTILIVYKLCYNVDAVTWIRALVLTAMVWYTERYSRVFPSTLDRTEQTST